MEIMQLLSGCCLVCEINLLINSLMQPLRIKPPVARRQVRGRDGGPRGHRPGLAPVSRGQASPRAVKRPLPHEGVVQEL